MTKWLAVCLLVLSAEQLRASVTCEDVTFDAKAFTVCKTATPEKIGLHLREGEDIIGSFRRLETLVGPLAFATNAGMYHPDRRPVGHYVEEGVEAMRVIASAGPGNFGMLPNGVFCVEGGTAHVFETTDYLSQSPECRIATQSGPMLVIDGALHPRFIPGSSALNVRNGVGVSASGDVVFAISNERVNFHTFARLFRDHLKVPNALYLDGRISRLHAPELGRSDGGVAMGPILSVRP